MVYNFRNVRQVLQKFGVKSDLVTQYFSMFGSGSVSHGRRQHLCDIVLGVKIADFVFSQMFSLIVNQSFL